MYRDMAIDEIEPNPDQPRKLFDEEALDELAASIRKAGLLQPIAVRPVDGRFVIIAGERRWRASKRAGLAVVPVRIIEGLDEEGAYVLSVTENVNRADMTIIEEANAFDKLRGLGRAPKQIAELFGKTEAYVTWRLGFLTLTEEAERLVSAGTLKPFLAYYVARCNGDNQAYVLRRYMRGDFPTESEAIAFAQALKANEDQPVMFGEELSEEEVQQRRAATAKARKVLDRISALTQLLAEIGDTDPMDLAGALGGRASTEAARMEDVYKVALKARKAMRSARAIAQAATVTVEVA